MNSERLRNGKPKSNGHIQKVTVSVTFVRIPGGDYSQRTIYNVIGCSRAVRFNAAPCGTGRFEHQGAGGRYLRGRVAPVARIPLESCQIRRQLKYTARHSPILPAGFEM